MSECSRHCPAPEQHHCHQKYFEAKTGGSVYMLLPGIENCIYW